MRRGSERYVAVVIAIALGVSGCKARVSDDTGGGTVLPVLRAGVVRPASLDPARARSVDEVLVADHLFDTLVTLDPATLAPIPGLAASWTASPDQMHWEFTLRPGITFSNGSPIGAADVKATLDRVALSATGSSVSDLLERVQGYAAVHSEGSTSLSGVNVVSPTVISVDLDSPWSELPSVLANPAFGVVAASEVGEPWPADASAVVTSGPFVVRATSADSLSLVPAEAVESGVERFDVDFFDNADGAFDALVAGDVDWARVPPARVAEAQRIFGANLFRPALAELFYAMNLRSPKLGDPRLREAIAKAVDRSKIVGDVYDGTVLATDRLLLEGLPGSPDGACAAPCGFDPDRSRALVAEIVAGGGAVPEIQIDFEDESTQSVVAKEIRDDLVAAGIPAALRPKPLDQYEQFAVSGDQEVFRLGWIPPFASADAVLSPLFETGAPNNVIGFSSPPVDELLRAARLESDASARAQKWQEAETQILGQWPVVPLVRFVHHSVAAPGVSGLVVGATGTFDARMVTMSASRK